MDHWIRIAPPYSILYGAMLALSPLWSLPPKSIHLFFFFSYLHESIVIAIVLFFASCRESGVGTHVYNTMYSTYSLRNSVSGHTATTIYFEPRDPIGQYSPNNTHHSEEVPCALPCFVLYLSRPLFTWHEPAPVPSSARTFQHPFFQHSCKSVAGRSGLCPDT